MNSREILAAKIKKVTDRQCGFSILHRPYRAIEDFSLMRSGHEIVMHYNLKEKNSRLLKDFAKRALPLHLQLIELLSVVEVKAIQLQDEVLRDPLVPHLLIRRYVEYKTLVAEREKNKFEDIMSDLLRDEQCPGYVEAKKYFSFLKNEYVAAIDCIMEWAEENLEPQLKKDIYTFQKFISQMINMQKMPSLKKEQEIAARSEKLHIQAADEKSVLELDPQARVRRYQWRRSQAFGALNTWYGCSYSLDKEKRMLVRKPAVVEQPTFQLGCQEQSLIEVLEQAFEEDYYHCIQVLSYELRTASTELTMENYEKAVIEFKKAMRTFAQNVTKAAVVKLKLAALFIERFQSENEKHPEYEDAISFVMLLHSDCYRKITEKVRQVVNANVIDLLKYIKKKPMASEVKDKM